MTEKKEIIKQSKHILKMMKLSYENGIAKGYKLGWQQKQNGIILAFKRFLNEQDNGRGNSYWVIDRMAFEEFMKEQLLITTNNYQISSKIRQEKKE